jgi:hypothetical protein
MIVKFPSLPSGFSVFCDDIRQEVGGKITLVGAYAGELIVFGEPSSILPKLSALVVVRFSPDDLPGPFKIRAFYTEFGKEDRLVFEGDIGGEFEECPPFEPNGDTFPFGESRALLSIPNLVLSGPGYVKVRAYYRDIEVRLGVLEIKFQPPAEDGGM